MNLVKNREVLKKEGWILLGEHKKKTFGGSTVGAPIKLWLELDELCEYATFYFTPPPDGQVSTSLPLLGCEVSIPSSKSKSAKKGSAAAANQFSLDDTSSSTSSSPSPSSSSHAPFIGSASRSSSHSAMPMVLPVGCSSVPSSFSPPVSTSTSLSSIPRGIVNNVGAFPLNIKLKSGKLYRLYVPTSEEREEWKETLLKARDFSYQTSMQILEAWNKDNECSQCVIDPNEVQQDSSGLSEIEGENDPFQVLLEDYEGNQVPLKSIVNAAPLTVLTLLRHFGCMLCRQASGHLLQRREEFESMGIAVIAVGTGTPAMAKSFKKEFGFPGNIYVDQRKKLYRSLSLKSGFSKCFSLKTLQQSKQAMKEGYSQGSIQGDPLQLGGCFVLSPARGGSIIFRHVEHYAGNNVNIEKLLSFLRRYCDTNSQSTWSSHKVPTSLAWNSLISTGPPPTSSSSLFVLHNQNMGYRYELGNTLQATPVVPTPTILHATKYYQDVISQTNHTLWVTNSPEVGAVVVALLHRDRDTEKSNSDIYDTSSSSSGSSNDDSMILEAPSSKALAFTDHGVTKVYVPGYLYKEKEQLKYVTSRLFRKEVQLKKPEQQIRLRVELLNLEHQITVKTYKFGVLLARDGQVLESELYGNNVTSTHPSPDFDEFLSFLGEKIELAGWKKFRGGLSASEEGLTGKHSIYTPFDQFEIMFHVAPLIPATEDEQGQFIERKKYLGNDILIVIFAETTRNSEGFTPRIDPAIFKSQFNHVFVIVTKEVKDSKTFYRVNIACRSDVPPCVPTLTNPPVYEKTEEFRRFFLSKLINSERAAMEAGAFSKKLKRTYGSLLKEVVTNALEGKLPTPSTARGDNSNSNSTSTSISSISTTTPIFSSTSAISTSPTSGSYISPRSPLPVSPELSPRYDEPLISLLSYPSSPEDTGDISEMSVHIFSAINSLSRLLQNSGLSPDLLVSKTKRFIVHINDGTTGDKKPESREKDIVEVRDLRGLADLKEQLVLKLDLNGSKTIENIKFEGVVLQEKHVQMLKDRDCLEITLCN